MLSKTHISIILIHQKSRTNESNKNLPVIHVTLLWFIIRFEFNILLLLQHAKYTLSKPWRLKWKALIQKKVVYNWIYLVQKHGEKEMGISSKQESSNLFLPPSLVLKNNARDWVCLLSKTCNKTNVRYALLLYILCSCALLCVWERQDGKERWEKNMCHPHHHENIIYYPATNLHPQFPMSLEKVRYPKCYHF